MNDHNGSVELQEPIELDLSTVEVVPTDEGIIDITESEITNNYKEYSNKPIQKVIYKHIIRKQSGMIIGVTGRPNAGKSWLGNKMIKDWNPKLHLQDYLTYEVDNIFEKTFSNLKINGKVMSKEEFNNIADIKAWCRDNINTVSIKQGKALLVDEAGTSIYNRDFFSPENKAMSKLVQVWRFMRMLVIFVIPERVEFLEKTLREFFDAKIVMTGKNEEEGYASAIMYERKGRNFKDEPIFARVNGCKHGGFIKVRPFSNNYPEDAKEYERLSKIYKTQVIMLARRDVLESSGQWVKKNGKRQSDIEEFSIDYVRNWKVLQDADRRSKTGTLKFSVELVQNKYNIGTAKARRIVADLEQKKKSGLLPE